MKHEFPHVVPGLECGSSNNTVKVRSWNWFSSWSWASHPPLWVSVSPLWVETVISASTRAGGIRQIPILQQLRLKAENAQGVFCSSSLCTFGDSPSDIFYWGSPLLLVVGGGWCRVRSRGISRWASFFPVNEQLWLLWMDSMSLW